MRSRVTLLPKLFSHWWETLETPHRLLDQHFGRSLRPDFFDRSLFKRFPYSYYQPWLEFEREEESPGWSEVHHDKDKYRVVLDVQQFNPEEVNVKVVDNYIVVEGKHEDKRDDHGIISRHFIRKYLVPEQCDPEKAASTLTSDGVLTITAPLKPEAIESAKEKTIKIEHIAKPVEEEEPQRMKQKQ